VPVPAIVSIELYAQVQARLGQNRTWAMRNTQRAYLLRCLVSYARCGLAYHAWTNGRYVSYHCCGAGTLLNRLRPEPYGTRQVPAADLDALVWDDVCQVLSEPATLGEALRRARQGWLTGTSRWHAARTCGNGSAACSVRSGGSSTSTWLACSRWKS